MGKRTLFTDFDEVSNILPKWQHKELLSSQEERVLYAFITNVCNDRWNRHFKNRHKDWVSSAEMRLQLPIVFMDYLLTRKSVRVKGPNGYYCELDNPQYKALGLVLFEFRRQFPCIVSMLTAWSTGITVFSSGNLNFYQRVNSTHMQELHKSLMMLRMVAKEDGTPLYSTHRYQLLNKVWRNLYGSKAPALTEHLTTTCHKRRASIMYAAADILAMRIHTSHPDLLRNLKHTESTRYDDTH